MATHNVPPCHIPSRHAPILNKKYNFRVMQPTGYTKVSDLLIDIWLPHLSEAELKILIIITRQTVGWNKQQDRISHQQFKKKSGLSARSITSAIESLSSRNFIKISDKHGSILSANERRFKASIYYQVTDFTDIHVTNVNAKLDNTPTQNLPLTIYNTYKQQETPLKAFEIKKQSEQERIECMRKQQRNISCSCFRCR